MYPVIGFELEDFIAVDNTFLIGYLWLRRALSKVKVACSKEYFTCKMGE